MIRALVAEPDSLVLRPRCHVLYDVIATDGAGQEAMVAAGLEEEAARELFHAATGEKWTREALEAREQP